MSKVLEDFVAGAIKHYAAKYAEERERWGITVIADDFVEHNINVLIRSGLWEQLAKPAKAVCRFPGMDTQTVFVIFSESEIPRPEQVYKLWLVATLADSEESLEEKLDRLEAYDGPYELEIPDEVYEIHDSGR